MFGENTCPVSVDARHRKKKEKDCITCGRRETSKLSGIMTVFLNPTFVYFLQVSGEK
jgi:hypothetical protein